MLEFVFFSFLCVIAWLLVCERDVTALRSRLEILEAKLDERINDTTAPRGEAEDETERYCCRAAPGWQCLREPGHGGECDAWPVDLGGEG